MDVSIELKLSNFFQKYRLIKYKKGETLYRPGDIISNISFLKSGYVRLFSMESDGKEHTIGLFKPVFYLTLLDAVKNIENKYYFEALTPVEVWSAPKEDVLEFIKENRDVSYFLNVMLLNVVDELLSNVEHATTGYAYKKVVLLLLSLAKNYGVEENGSIVLNFGTTQTLIASLTGITRETANIQIKKLESEGFIQKRDQFLIIHDIANLSKAVYL